MNLPLLRRRASEGLENVPPAPVAIRHIAGNLTFTATETWAWYGIPPAVWSFRSVAQRQQLLEAVTQRFTELVPARIRLRTSARPYPAWEWARNLDRRTPRPLPDGRGVVETYDWLLEAQQRRLQSSSLAEKTVAVGVRVGPRVTRDRIAALRAGVRDGEIKKLADRIKRVGQIIGGDGLAGRPLDAEQMAWLMHRSLALGVPTPGPAPGGDEWEGEDLHHFTDPVRYETTPFGRTVKVVARRGGTEIVRHVAVLTMGRMEAIDIPESGKSPWMLHADQLPFPVEWSSTVDLLPGRAVAGGLERQMRLAKSQIAHYAEHDEEPPPSLDRVARTARRKHDEATEGMEVDACRANGYHRLAVYGASEDEALDRAQQVIDHYAGQMRMSVEHPVGQFAMAREFVPGEPNARTGYLRRMPMRYFAAGLPHVSSMVGDGVGPYLGYTCGTARRAVMFDPHYTTEVMKSSGLVVIGGTPGSGKSNLIGVVSYLSARRGIPTVVLDPSGPLAALTAMPELAAHSRHIDLTRAAPGALNPYALIPPPRRNQFDSDRDWRDAVIAAEQERKLLATDVCRMLLPDDVLTRGGTSTMLGGAIRAVGGGAGSDLWAVIDFLESETGGAEIAANLRDAADLSLARLFFPDRSSRVEHQTPVDTVLTVLTMPGIVLPPEHVARAHWTLPEMLAVPLMHLATYYTTRVIYGLPMADRKVVCLDENHLFKATGSGRALFTRLGRDSRKHNACVLAGSQNPADVLDENVANFVKVAFVGRIEDEQTARESLRMLKVPADCGYERVLGTFPVGGAPYREFLMRDAFGRVDRIRIDHGWHPGLAAALNTDAANDSTGWAAA
ncbi:MAG: ATP-binding protein [Pseudonocardiales bacterium]